MTGIIDPPPPAIVHPLEIECLKTRIITRPECLGSNLIARFGRARLLERADGRAELRDASPAEETEAKEWISLFDHDTILRVSRS